MLRAPQFGKRRVRSDVDNEEEIYDRLGSKPSISRYLSGEDNILSRWRRTNAFGNWGCGGQRAITSKAFLPII